MIIRNWTKGPFASLVAKFVRLIVWLMLRGPTLNIFICTCSRKEICCFFYVQSWDLRATIILFFLFLDQSWAYITIVRIEFSPLGLINVSNGHYYTLETTEKDQLVVTSDIWSYYKLYLLCKYTLKIMLKFRFY